MRVPRLLLLGGLAVVLAARRGKAEATPTPAGAQCLDATCFALFWAARSFAGAGEACAAGGGHLMTVRSTVAAEAIALLWRGRPGSAWLGLRLPEGSCVPPAAPALLRGFQWATGDERTDYAAWANATAEDPACGPRCVVVTPELSWRERACDAPADGFLCEYSYPGGTCAPLPEAATYLLPFGARETDLGAVPSGAAVQLPGLGLSLECRARGEEEEEGGGAPGWSRAEPGAWDCRLANGGCEGRCLVDGRGQPSCACPEGQALREDDGRRCRPPCADPGCPRPCLSHEEEGEEACVCMEGYAPGADGRSCVDVDDCAAEPGPCEQECVNTEGAFECRCWPGFVLEQGRCEEDWQQRCFDLSCQHDCARVAGRLRCTCFEGFAPNPRKPRECLPFCNQTECPAWCDPHTGESCDCPEGFVLDEKPDGTTVCADIDECGADYCGALNCINMPGSYKCTCPDGGFCLGDEDGFSGEAEPTDLSPVPPKDGISRGMLIGISLGVTSVAVLLLALLCYMVKKHHFLQTGKDYTCQQTESGVVLQHVSPNSASSRQKM